MFEKYLTVGKECKMFQYDNYLTKLQNICTENVGEEGKPVYETMKSAIQVFSLSKFSLKVGLNLFAHFQNMSVLPTAT